MFIKDRILGSVLGAAVGDSLGMPVEMLSHQNVRTYYRGIKGFMGDEKRGDLDKGQVTGRSQLMMFLMRTLVSGTPITELPRLRRVDPHRTLPDGMAISACAAFGLWAALNNDTDDDHLADHITRTLGIWIEKPATLTAGYGQARLIRDTIYSVHPPDGRQLLEDLVPAVRLIEQRLETEDAVSVRLEGLQYVFNGFPLDLQDYCDGTGPEPDQAWPFTVGMFARNPELVEAGMLSAVNVGGDAPTIGACLGGLFGALHGPDVFPGEWIEQLEIRQDIEDLLADLD